MPKALIPITASHISVSRRVAVHVVQHLAEIMGLPENTHIHLPGQTQAVPINNAEFGNCCKPNLNYPGDSRIIMTFIEEAEEDHTLTTSVLDKQNRPIIHDKDHNVEVRPVYRYVKLLCNIEFVAASSTQAQRWLDDQRAMFSAGRTEHVLDLEYYFQLPEGLIGVLKALHDSLMQSHWPIQETFEDWVVGHLVNGAYPKNLTTLSGRHNTLAVAEHQFETLGWFDWTTTPDTPERNDDGSGTYTVNLTFQLGYGRPTHVHIDYPMVMRQRPIPKLYRLQEPYDHFRSRLRKVSLTKQAFDEFRFIEDNIGVVPYVHYPNVDDWYPYPDQRTLNNLIPLFTGLIMLGKDDQQTLMDLTQLGSCKFTPHFLEYFYLQGDKALNGLEAFFEFHLYRNHDRLSGVKLEFEPGTLKVRTKEPLDPTYMYHVQILVKRNWLRVSQSARTCLRNYPTVAWTLARLVGVYLGGARSPAELDFLAPNRLRANDAPCYGEGYLLPDNAPADINWGLSPDDVFIRNGVVKVKDIEQAARDTDKVSDKFIDREAIGPVTVMYSDILTFRKQE